MQRTRSLSATTVSKVRKVASFVALQEALENMSGRFNIQHTVDIIINSKGRPQISNTYVIYLILS